MFNTHNITGDASVASERSVSTFSGRPQGLPIDVVEHQSIMTNEAGPVLPPVNMPFTVPAGGAILQVPRFQVDDWGFCGVIPEGLDYDSAPAEFKIDCRETEADRGPLGGHAQWGGSISNAYLPPGDYTLVVEQCNAEITGVANKSLLDVEVHIVPCVPQPPSGGGGGDDGQEDDTPVDTDDAPPAEPEEEPVFCRNCGCGNCNDSEFEPDVPGDPELEDCAESLEYESDETEPAVLAVDAADDAPAVLPGGFKSRSAWDWSLTQNLPAGLITITPPAATPLHFRILPGSAQAALSGGARMYRYALQLQDSLGNPCADGTHQLFCLTAPDGARVCFDLSGKVVSRRSAAGREVEVAEHAAAVVQKKDAAGHIESVYSAKEGLMRSSLTETGETHCEWFAPAQVTVQGDAYVTSGAPYKTETYCTTLRNGVKTTTVTRQQTGLPAHTVTRVEDGNTTTTIKGEGAEAIIRTVVKNMLPGNQQEEIETLRRAGDAEPASCTRTLRQRTAGGWLTLQTTEAYNTPLARTTYHVYDDAYLLCRTVRPDGGYTEYVYDEERRVVEEISPWGAGGRQRTRYVYSSNSARFFDNRPVKVYSDYQVAGSSSWLNIKVVDYTYEETDAVERTSSRTYAAGVSHQQVSIEESYGASPAYAYAAGKPKFSQAVNGVQTVHDYAATAEHGAVHKHTTTTMAAGELVPGQSRRTEEFIAADDTVTFEQESIWDGATWLLLATKAYEYDEQRRVVKTSRGNGRATTTAWMCCGKLSETDEDGITTTYGYNSAHELVETIRPEVRDGDTLVTPETITTYTRDAAGRTLGTRRDTGAMTTTESTAYDALGRVISRTDTLGRVTATAYSEDGLTTTVTAPSGATTITTAHADGSTARISGTAQREVVYSYSLQSGCICEMQTLADGTIIAQTTTNGFGETVVQAQPNTLGGFICTRSEYNARGQLVKTWSDTGLDSEPTAATLYEYDSMGNVVKQTLALAENPTPENAPITESAYGTEALEDGVYSVITTTRYNAAAQPLTSVQKQLISQLSALIESKSVFVSERGLTSTQWTEYSGGTKRVQYSTVPGSSITAETVTVSGVALSQKDTAGVVTTFTRSYTVNGMVLTQTDGRGNTTTTVADKAGRSLMVTDAAGNVTTTVYCDCCDQPATITDAQGNTTCYRYDERGRKVAEWGTAVQPVTFGYDEAGRLVMLTTFRNPDAVLSTDPGELTGDVTTWTYDPATGLELSKTYADGTAVVKTYDAHNRLVTETNARGKMKGHTYEHARGLLLGTTYYHAPQDGEEPVTDSLTPARSYAYNHLGQLTQVTDAAGTRTISYNQYGEQDSDSLVVDGDTHLITETRDAQGRSTGYVYSKNGATQQTVTTGYGEDGRINSAGFLHGGAEKQFSYEYLTGTHLLQKLTKPNGMSLTQSYEPQRDLLTGMAYNRGSTLVTQRTYTYDSLGRPLNRSTARSGQTVNDSFGYNNRSELTTATVNGGAYAYDYDNIGNRKTAQEATEEVTGYTANELNQYTALAVDGVTDFQPEYDADGNQTRVKTSTGIWAITYDTENRPTDFTSMAADNTITTVHCEYDHMGRRAIKRVMVNGNVTLHQRYIYRGYLQIACIDLTRSHHPVLWYITWDPTQSIATRPLAIQKDGTWYTYGWDLTKNICEVYRNNGTLGTSYTYSPYGQVSAEGATEQPIQWSSEFNDTELGLIYYNYRHYNPVDGRWTGRDCLNIPTIPAYIYYNPLFTLDYVGNLTMSARSYGASIERRQLYDIEWDMALDSPAKNRLYIVQKIIKDISVIWCYSTHDSMKSSRERYWEAWLVYKKEIKPRVPKGQVIDRWYQDMPKIKNTKGEVVMTSEAKVFPRSVTGDLGDQMKNTGNYPGADSRLSEWKPAEYNEMSGGISSTNNQPRWWNSPSLEKTTKQKVEITWDYCECKYDYEMKINGEVVIHNLIS